MESGEKVMDPNQRNINNKKVNKAENWVDDVMERQKEDLKAEEEFLSIVPNRIKHKYLETDEEE